MNREVQDSEIQKRVELVRLKARQVGNMEPESPGLVNAAAQAQLAKLIPAREQVELAAIEVEKLPPPVDPNVYSESLTDTLATLEGELAKEHDFLFPDNSALEAEIDVEKRNELVDDFGLDAEGAALGFAPAAEEDVLMAPRVRLSLVDRVIQQESGGDPLAVSPVGASGLMQVMEATAADPGFGVTPLDWSDRFDPELNRAFGTEYLAALMARYDGDEEAALIAYNAGFGRADKWLAAGRDYEPFKGYTDDDGTYVSGWADESEPYVANIMGNQTLAPARVATYGDVTYNLQDVTDNASLVAEAQAAVAQSELAQVGAQIPGKTQAESVNDFILPRAADPLVGVDTSYLPTEAAPVAGDALPEITIEMTPLELGLVEYHRDNLTNGTYLDDELGMTTVNILGVTGPDGQIYNVPGFVDGKRLSEEEASNNAALVGWDNFPSYLDGNAANLAAQKVHEQIDIDGKAFRETAEGTEAIEQADWTPTYTADVLAHHAAAQGLRDMAYLPEVQLALENMNSDVLLAWSDATRGHDDLHKGQAESALLAAGFVPRAHLGEELPSDRFFNVFAYARIDGGRASDQQRADAGEGPLRQILAASRRMVFNR